MTGDPQLRWLRLWTDIIEDPKLLLLAAQDRWYYIGLLALKRTGMLDEGDDPALRDRKIALRLRYDERYELTELKRRFIEARLIDDDWQPLGWEKRQFQSDQGDGNASERMRRYRNRKRNARNTVTVELRPEQRQSRDRTEKEKEPPKPPADLDLAAWDTWLAYRVEIRKPLKPASILAAQRKLAAFGSEQATAVEQSIANGWTGLFAPKAEKTRRASGWE